MAKKLSVIIICVLALIVFANTSHSADEATLLALESFMAEVETIGDAIVEAEAVKVKLKQQEKDLLNAAGLLKEFGANAVRKHKEVQEKLNESGRQIGAHSSECTDSYDKSWVEECNKKAKALNATHGRLLKEREITKGKIKFLDERRGVLNQDVLDWAEKVKENNFVLDELRIKERDLLTRVKSSLDSPDFIDLKQRANAVKDCAAIMGLEGAHHCLQKISDGAAD